METRWHLSPGQSLATTKIEDRGHAIHATKDAWKNITAHLDRTKIKEEDIVKEQIKRDALKRESAEMTKDWYNSVKNIYLRKEEARLKKVKDKQIEQIKNFYTLRKEQADIKTKYIEDVKKSMSRSEGFPKCLANALLEGEVYHEREKQVELKNQIRKHLEEVETKYGEKVKLDAQKELNMDLEKANKLLQENKIFQNMLLDDINKRAEEKQNYKAASRAKEIRDNRNANKESEKIQADLLRQELEKKATIKKEFEDFRKQAERIKEQEKLKQKEADVRFDAYGKAKQEITYMGLRKKEDMRRNLEKRVYLASNRLLKIMKDKSNDEEQIIQRAIAERDLAEKKLLQEKKAYHRQLIKDRQQNYENYLKHEAQRKLVEEKEKKLEMVNRLKANKEIAKYELDRKQKHWKEKLEYGRDLKAAMEENNKVAEAEQEEANLVCRKYIENLEKEDKNVLAYGDEVLKYAEKKGWSNLPIKKSIKEYKKKYILPQNCVRQCESSE